MHARFAALAALMLVLGSCSSVFRITPCRLGEKLAFQVPKRTFFGFSTPRTIERIAVTPRGIDADMWWTDDKRTLHDDYTRVVYGARLRGWTEITPAKALNCAETYSIMIVGDDGDGGDADFVPREVTEQCGVSEGA